MSEHQLIEAMRDLQRTVRRSMAVSAAISVLTAIGVCAAMNYMHSIELLEELREHGGEVFIRKLDQAATHL